MRKQNEALIQIHIVLFALAGLLFGGLCKSLSGVLIGLNVGALIGFGLERYSLPPLKDYSVEFLPPYKAIKLLEQNPDLEPVAQYLLERSESFIRYLWSKKP